MRERDIKLNMIMRKDHKVMCPRVHRAKGYNVHTDRIRGMLY